MLRGAISGFGEVAAQAHLAGWATRPGVTIVAVHDPIAERRYQALRLVKNVRVYDNLEVMLDTERPDFLDVASPPAFHASSAALALASGAHVLVEKPLCLSIEEFDQLAASAAGKSLVLMCVHNWKYAPAYRAAHEILASGRLGTLRYLALLRLRTEAAGVRNQSVEGAKWRLDPSLGGGILVDHGWHVFYLMQWLSGGKAPAQISAYLDYRPEAIVEDVADLRIRFSPGLIAYAHLSWRAPVRRTSAIVYGDYAALEIEDNRLIVTERSGKTEEISVTDTRDDSYHSAWFTGMAEQFEHAVADGPQSMSAQENITEAKVALKLTLAAGKSSRIGSTLNIIP